MSHPLISKLTKERDKAIKELASYKLADRSVKLEEAVRIAARERLQADMYSSVFKGVLESIDEDIDNARTIAEVRAWVKNDIIARFRPAFETTDFVESMNSESIIEQVGIGFNPAQLKVKLAQYQDEIRKEIEQ